MENSLKKKKSFANRFKVRWQLVFYDAVLLAIIEYLLFGVYDGAGLTDTFDIVMQCTITYVSVFLVRLIGNIYSQIWRYGGIQCYIRLLIVDCMAFAVNLIVEDIAPIKHISFTVLLAIWSINLLAALAIRMMYRYAYKCGSSKTPYGRFLNGILVLFAGKNIKSERQTEKQKIKIAIIGAGRIGVSLAEELLNNEGSSYSPQCFVDISEQKAGRSIHGIPVIPVNEVLFAELKEMEVQEIVFAVPNMSDERRKELYEYYKKSGFKVKLYDFPVMQTPGSKRRLREFEVEELLFRQPLAVANEKTSSYYRDKVVLITGGGGSIGSELCRQLAKMKPKQIIVLDVYENGAYDVQQELKIAYKGQIDLRVEIVSVCNRIGLERVFQEYHPQVVLNAAAHKHVPLMEKNCIEAVENNVFGTLNTVELSEKYGVERVMMVSTDKAVNPTNVMGATKRMCEMIVQSHAARHGKTTFSATRFGNVLGSAGSVIPLFKKQISNGGPVTVTDKRIIRYFMTIPEASQLVLQSGAMAENGELFVLDMGQPVKILELAENMIRVSGLQPYKDIDIIETGLRPGEKLYEELLVKTEELDKTENKMIFIERDNGLSDEELNQKLDILRDAIKSNDDEIVRAAMHMVVPTFKTPEEVNKDAEQVLRDKEEEKAAAAKAV